MKQIVGGILILLALIGTASIYRTASSSSQPDVHQRFVQLVKSEPPMFSSQVEKAVGDCAQLQGLSDDTSRRVRTISGKIVSKIMYLRADRDPSVDLKPQIMLWLREQLEPEINSLSNEQFDALTSAIGKIIRSSETIKCIVSSAVSRYE
ncbi:hypothetical protein M2281_003616 [Mesorhizobium soli]|uniref:hypothetical protein n=1 Tax=Pseudaminobacter soli (ex Li et al. 2025) TaxID=1295366 RepID=UPI002474EE7B|nr:hypothetical protein [Mesorhizobium soli]MDH6233005.1 hypothetical protein [Mesorhizobium soli]